MSETFTNIKVFKSKFDGKVKGNGSVVIGGMVEVKFTIVEGTNGLFVALPTRPYQDKKTGTTKYANEIAIPNRELYQEFQNVILEAFNKDAPKRERTNRVSEPSEPVDDNIPF